MPLLKDDTNLSTATGYLMRWRFEKTPPYEPLQLPRINYGFKYQSEFMRVPVNGLPFPMITMRDGMQGLVMEIRDIRARVRIYNLLWESKPIELILPIWTLQGGTKIYGGPKSWTLDVQVPIPDFSDTSDALLKSSQLEDTINAFLRITLSGNMSWLPRDFFTAVGQNGERIHSVTRTIIHGLHTAGMLEGVMNKPHFTIQDMLARCTPITRATAGNWTSCGLIYFVHYVLPDNSAYLYIGKTRNLVSRLETYRRSEINTKDPSYNGLHAKTRRNAIKKTMAPLCILPSMEDYKKLQGIVEQVFTSLLGTYRRDLIGFADKVNMLDRFVDDESSSARKGRMTDIEHCKVFMAITEKAFAKTGFECGVTWPGFGVSQGMNWQSPLPEWGNKWDCEPTIWLRADSFAVDSADGNTFPIANIRRSKRMLTHWIDKGSKPRGDTWYRAVWFANSYHGPAAMYVTLDSNQVCKSRDHIDDKLYPPEGATTWISWETRLDWGVHERAWSRLPDIAPYNDWDRARSWALKVEWKDKSGADRVRYMQSTRSLTTRKDDEGSIIGLSTYEIGLAISHYLFNDERRSNRPWVNKIDGYLEVRRLDMDCLTWTTSFKDQQKVHSGPYPPPNGNLRSDAVILINMKEQCRDILVIDEDGSCTSLAAFGVKGARRKKCDTCYMVNADLGECTKEDGNVVCTHCRAMFNRPACTWTRGISNKADSTWPRLLASNNQINQKRRKLLIDMKGEDDDTGAVFSTNYIDIRSTMTDKQQEELEGIAETLRDEEDD
jgi:hypothetical protein